MLKNKWIIGGVVIVLCVIVLAFLSLDVNAVYFYTPNEAQPQASQLAGKTIKVGGMVKGGSLERQPETLSVKFVLSDLQNANILVTYSGTPPDMFKENAGVVVEGQIAADGQSMVAKNLMVKHSEEYAAPADKHSVDKALLMKSIFGK